MEDEDEDFLTEEEIEAVDFARHYAEVPYGRHDHKHLMIIYKLSNKLISLNKELQAIDKGGDAN